MLLGMWSIGGGGWKPSKETDVLCLIVRDVAERPLGLDADLLLEGDRDGEGALEAAKLVICVMPALMAVAIAANSCMTVLISDCWLGGGCEAGSAGAGGGASSCCCAGCCWLCCLSL